MALVRDLQSRIIRATIHFGMKKAGGTQSLLRYGRKSALHSRVETRQLALEPSRIARMESNIIARPGRNSKIPEGDAIEIAELLRKG